MKKYILISYLIILSLVIIPNLYSSPAFITLDGSNFSYKDYIYKIKGSNYELDFSVNPSSWDMNAITSQVDILDSIGINVVRIKVPYNQYGWDSEVSETHLNKLEEVISIFGTRGIAVVLVLFDKDNSFPASGEEDEALQKQYLTSIINKFKNNHYIIFWDVKNHPDHPNNIDGYNNWNSAPAKKTLIVDWLDRMATHIKSIDSNHPITIGMRWYINNSDVISFVDIASSSSYWAYGYWDWPASDTQIIYLKSITSKPVLLSEFGWSSEGENNGTVFTESWQRQSYLSNLYYFTFHNTAGGIQWKAFDSSAYGGSNWEDYYGIIKIDNTLKPAAEYYRDNYPTRQFPWDDDIAPNTVTQLSFTGKGSAIGLSWLNPSDSDLRGCMIRYSTESYPATPEDGILVANINAAPSTESFYIHNGINPEITYYYSVFAYDFNLNYSAAVNIEAQTQPITFAEVRSLPNNSIIGINSVKVSAVFGAYIYITDHNRTYGLRVTYAAGGVAPGDVIDVSGVLRTININGMPAERQITAPRIIKISSEDPPKPMAMNNNAVGGSDYKNNGTKHVAGVNNGIGANNIGQLVKTTGRVKEISGNIVYIDDGSNVSAGSDKIGVAVNWQSSPDVNVGDYISVVGIIQGDVPSGWSTSRRYILKTVHTVYSEE